MNSASTVIISGLIAQYLPVENDMVKMQLGLFINELLSRGFNQTKIFRKILRYFQSPETRVIIKDINHQEINPIYQSFEEFLVRNHSSDLEGCELVPKNGDIELVITHNCQLTGITYQYNGHIIRVKMEETNHDDNSNSNNSSHSRKSDVGTKQIVLSSLTATTQQLRNFVKEKCKTTPHQGQLLKVYRSYSSPNSETRTTWEQIYIKTNKSIRNTIVNQQVEQNLYQDVNKFLANENWYTDKGIPYKRGYILHGPPGTGKTSIIKAIANEYNLPIFSIDLGSIQNNNDLVQLITDINYHVQDGRYILTFEDVDRTTVFRTSKYSYLKQELSSDCLLNVIDGVMETHGRIIFVTANNVTPLTEMEAFIRPGRIDKKILIDYCDTYQFNRMVTNFYQTPELTETSITKMITESGVACPDKLAPANLIDRMQQHPVLADFIVSCQSGVEHQSFTLDIPNYNQGYTNLVRGKRRSKRLKKLRERQLKFHQTQLKRAKQTVTRLSTKIIPKDEAQLAKTKHKIEADKILLQKIKRKLRQGGPYCSATTKKGLPCQQLVKNQGDCCRYHS